MSLFDLAAGLVLVVSVLVGWIRGATREVTTVAALVLAAVFALFALRYTGPVARHAIHTLWLANIAAILMVFAAVYIILRVAAGALTRGIHRTSALGGFDRMIGAGFGAARALILLGLVNLTLTSVTPTDRIPPWISGAAFYPVSGMSAQALKTFAPKGASLARQVYPAVGKAITSGDAAPADGDTQNRDYTQPPTDAPRLRVEKTP
jgi:membrane protein required for colicin V production